MRSDVTRTLRTVRRAERNFNQLFYLSTMPAILCIGGIVFFHWGVATGVAISMMAMFAGISNSIQPLLKQQYDGEQLGIRDK